MQKIILVIIAAIVNQIASGQDQSKSQDNGILVPVNQCCNEEKVILEPIKGASWICTKDFDSNTLGKALSWDLFVNFNPRYFRISDSGK